MPSTGWRSSSVFDHVADAAHRGDQTLLMLRVDLLAQVVDHDVDDVRSWVKVIPPSVLSDQRAAHDAPRVPHEILEDRVFLRREVDELAAAPDLSRRLIEDEVAHGQRR